MLSIITILEIAKEVAKMLAKEIVIFGDRLPYKKQQKKQKISLKKHFLFLSFFFLSVFSILPETVTCTKDVTAFHPEVITWLTGGWVSARNFT